MNSIRRDILVCLFLVIAILAVYWQVRYYDFITYDDGEYVSENHHVLSGLTLDNIIWAFTTIHSANWHPMTWLSHMLDIHIYGLNPGQHHITNVLFHIVNSLLLFLVFTRMTGTLWQSAFIAALFALHPLHVESVAWISERKDVLSTFFWMLTLRSYILYDKDRRLKTYLPLLIWFSLGLMSKPMLVTLPCVLFLVDYWKFETRNSKLETPASNFKFLILEKVPLFALSIASSIITFIAQKKAGAVAASLYLLPFGDRFANALVSYISYIAKMIWPQDLAVLYPHPGSLPIWQPLGASLLLLFVFFLAIRYRKNHCYLIVGWLWYVGTLVPVIGLVQVGRQAMADRYTYIPLIGLFIIIAWGVPEMLARWRWKKLGLAIITALVLFPLMVTTWLQLRYWSDSITLYKHTLSVTKNNYTIHYNLGNAFLNKGELDDAIRHFSKSLKIDPSFYEAYNNIGLALAQKGKTEEAMAHYMKSLHINPLYKTAHYNIANALLYQGKLNRAIEHYSEAVRIEPQFMDGHNSLGLAFIRRGNINEAIAHFREALRINPNNTATYRNLRRSLTIQERIDKAVLHIHKALKINIEEPVLDDSLKNLENSRNELDRVIQQYQQVLSPQPGYNKEHLDIHNYERLYAVIKQYDMIYPLLKKLSKLGPGSPEAFYLISCIYDAQNEIEKSAE